ncbi:MAG: sigma 54-interacting transcriptional regulator [Magnetococcales bacterium]|nr:sigma 54-interacting transcriptional regulator [Magnetococcales bacterium]
MANSNSAIVGSSKIIRATLARAEKVARTQLPVLITGESGTGKELFARHVHDHSSRAGRPYVAINCASVPGELLESEFFGYKQGAFSGAKDNRDGLFVQADGGTLFLDEIGDMPLPLQAKILRVLQEGEVRPLGAKSVQKVNVRIVAATHQDLGRMVADGKFREDLLFRLRGYALHLPPLRDRERDVIALTRMILKSMPEFANKDLSRDLQELLLTYPWPGNVRELRNAVLAAAVDAPRSIGANHLRPYLAVDCLTTTVVPVIPVVDRLWMELADGKQISLAQLHDRLRIPKTTLHRHISHLVEQGRICRHEEGGGVCFVAAVANTVAEQILPDRQAQAILLAKTSGRITRQQFADAVGISIRTAGRELAAMVNLGLLMADGRGGKMGGYVPCNR